MSKAAARQRRGRAGRQVTRVAVGVASFIYWADHMYTYINTLLVMVVNSIMWYGYFDPASVLVCIGIAHI